MEYTPRHAPSDHARLRPLPHWRAAVGANRHLRCADAARALMAARHGKVRLRASKAHDARGLATERGFGNVVAGDVADIGKRQVVWLSRSRRHLGSRRSRHYLRARGRAAAPTAPTAPAAPTAPGGPTTACLWEGRRH